MGVQRNPREPITVTWEIEMVDGEEGRLLARHQAEVMLVVLAWIAAQRSGQTVVPDADDLGRRSG